MTTLFALPNILSVAVLTAALAALGGSGGQAANIRGYYDPTTRSFTPLAQQVQPTQPAKLTSVDGTFKIAVSVKIDPQIPAKTPIYASVTVIAQDPPTYNPALNYTYNLGGNLTREGNTGTVTLTYPFFWEVADPTAPVTFQVQLSEGNGPQTQFQPFTQFSKSVPMPKTGATTLVTLGGTI